MSILSEEEARDIVKDMLSTIMMGIKEYGAEGKREYQNIMRSSYRGLIKDKFDGLLKELKISGQEIENREKTYIMQNYDWNKFVDICIEYILVLERKTKSSMVSEEKFIDEWRDFAEEYVVKNVNQRLDWYKENTLDKSVGKYENRNDKVCVESIGHEVDLILKGLGKVRVRKINELENKDARRRIIAHIKLCNMLAYEQLVKYKKIDDIKIKASEKYEEELKILMKDLNKNL